MYSQGTHLMLVIPVSGTLSLLSTCEPITQEGC